MQVNENQTSMKLIHTIQTGMCQVFYSDTVALYDEQIEFKPLFTLK